MAAPIANKITLPSDTGNSGKNVRTQTRVVGANTVHEHFFIPATATEATSKFFWSSTQQTVSVNVQDGTTTGFYFLNVPTAATTTALIRRINIDSNAGSALATPTAPVLTFSKYTYTGTASGTVATNSPVPYKTGASTNQMIVRTAMTGQTITLVGPVGQFAFPTNQTGVGVHFAQKEVLPFNPLAYQRGMCLEIGALEGIAIWQSVAGTAADTRRFGIQIEWDEIDLT